jgi:hypothetical protein
LFDILSKWRHREVNYYTHEKQASRKGLARIEALCLYNPEIQPLHKIMHVVVFYYKHEHLKGPQKKEHLKNTKGRVSGTMSNITPFVSPKPL